MAEAIAMRVRKEILSGSQKALEMGLKLSEKLGPKEEEAEDGPELDMSNFSRLEKLIWRQFIIRGYNNTLEPKYLNNPELLRVTGVVRLYVREDGYMGFDRVIAEPKSDVTDKSDPLPATDAPVENADP